MLNLNYEPNIIKSTANLTREEWLKDRRLGIGGSEASIVMGVSPWATRRDLYYDKIGRKPIRIDPEEDNWVAKQVGNRLEELVAMIFSISSLAVCHYFGKVLIVETKRSIIYFQTCIKRIN